MVDFRRRWWGTDLGDHRPCQATYRAFAADTLPPLPQHLFTGTFDWLPVARPANHVGSLRTAETGRLVAAARDAGLRLPDPFLRFLGDRRRQRSIPTSTDCYLDLAPAPVPSPFEPDAYFVRFLSDSQDCLLWYLHCTPDEVSVVAAAPGLDDRDAAPASAAEVDRCADGFEEFVFRFWAENVLWFHLHHDDPAERDLPPELAEYLRHYAVRPDPDGVTARRA